MNKLLEHMRTEEEIEKDLKNSRASVEVEGLTPSKENDDICRKLLKGEISSFEANEMILKFHDIKS